MNQFPTTWGYGVTIDDFRNRLTAARTCDEYTQREIIQTEQ